MTKAELARMAGCSPDTFRLWLKRIEPEIPAYRKNQRLLTPAQVKVISELLCIELPP